MSNYYRQTRQLPLAQHYENSIMHQEMCDREKIIAGRCMDMVRIPQKKFSEPRIVDADVTIHVATHMKDNPGPGAYAIMADDGSTADVDYLAETTGWHLELVAINAALQSVKGVFGSAVMNTTAANIVKYLNNGQVAKWSANGWRKSHGEPIAHSELWRVLLARYEIRDPAIVVTARNASPAMRKCAEVAKQTFKSGTCAKIRRRR